MKSELLWNLAEYKKYDVEPPSRMKDHPDMCEGDLMTNDEVEAFIKDSIATLRILSDKNSARFEEVKAMYKADMAALLECARIEDDEYVQLVDDRQLQF